MLKHSRHLLAAAILAALFVAPAAFAGSGKNPKYPSSCVSAVCVYHEPGVTGVGGPSNGSSAGTNPQKPITLSASVMKKLNKYGGKDKSIIQAITQNPGFGPTRALQTQTSGPVTEPSALGAAFDAGSGMTILISVLIGTTALLAAFEGVRLLRRR